MIKYTPFLKAKQNEIKAMSELPLTVRSAIRPFFDFPKKRNGYTKGAFISFNEGIHRRLVRNLGDSEFYFDNFDLDPLDVDGKDSYWSILNQLSGMNVIPVVGLDRSNKHSESVSSLQAVGKLRSRVVAFRIAPDDFDSFEVVEDDIDENLSPVFDLFDSIDLIFDCRVCNNLNAATVASSIKDFSAKFCSVYSVRHVVVTGSSIPASIKDILKVDSEHTISRRELEIYEALKSSHTHARLVFGDYTTVSPHYSDVDMPPEMLQNIMTAKLTYTIPGGHYFIRGSGLKVNGAGQYFGMAKKLCSKSFFRGREYSPGDAYFDSKGKGIGKNCAPNAVIKPSVIAHISYMVLNAGI